MLDSSLIHSITIGKFRMPKTYFKKIIKIRPEDTFQFNSLIQKSDEENQMIKLFYKQLQNYVDKKKIFLN